MSLTGTGVLPGPNVKIGGYIMLITAVSYLVIQGPALFYVGQSHEQVAAAEHNWAVAGFILCTIMFVGYLAYQYYLSQAGNEVTEQKRGEVIKEKIQKGEVSLLGVMFGYLDAAGSHETSSLLNSQLKNKLEQVLKPFFEKYDVDRNGSIDMSELAAVFHVCVLIYTSRSSRGEHTSLQDLNENKSQKELHEMFQKFDKDRNGAIDYPEFVQGVAEYVISEKARLQVMVEFTDA